MFFYKPKYLTVVQWAIDNKRAFTAIDIIHELFPAMGMSTALELIQTIAERKEQYDIEKTYVQYGHRSYVQIRIKKVKVKETVEIERYDPRKEMSPALKLALGLK